MADNKEHGDNSRNGHTSRFIEYAIIVLAIVLAVLVISFVLNYEKVHREALIEQRESWLSMLVAHRGTPTADEISFVRSWMTFDYINRLFQIPPQYLEIQLSITDPGYPKITIEEYAEHIHTSAASVMSSVTTALQAYFATVPTSTSAARTTTSTR